MTDRSVLNWLDDTVPMSEFIFVVNARMVVSLSFCHFIFQLIFRSHNLGNFHADEKNLVHAYTIIFLAAIVQTLFCCLFVGSTIAAHRHADHDIDRNLKTTGCADTRNCRDILEISSIGLKAFTVMLMLRFLLSVKGEHEEEFQKSTPNLINAVALTLATELIACLRRTTRFACKFIMKTNGFLMAVNWAVGAIINFARMIMYCCLMFGVDRDFKSLYVDIIVMYTLFFVVSMVSLRVFTPSVPELHSCSIVLLHCGMLMRVYIISGEVGMI
jgi:hypothetical protein